MPAYAFKIFGFINFIIDFNKTSCVSGSNPLATLMITTGFVTVWLIFSIINLIATTGIPKIIYSASSTASAKFIVALISLLIFKLPKKWRFKC